MLDRSLDGNDSVARGAWEIPVTEFFKEDLGNDLRHAVFTGTIHRNIESNVVVNEQAQVAVKPLSIPAVPDDTMSVVVCFIEAEHHPVQWPDPRQRRVVHFL